MVEKIDDCKNNMTQALIAASLSQLTFLETHGRVKNADQVIKLIKEIKEIGQFQEEAAPSKIGLSQDVGVGSDLAEPLPDGALFEGGEGEPDLLEDSEMEEGEEEQ